VIDGLAFKNGESSKKYVYRGLYRVVDHWDTVGAEHWIICQFKLVKADSDEVAEKFLDEDWPSRLDGPGAGSVLEDKVRRYIQQNRMVRDASVVKKIKEFYGGECQICRRRLRVTVGGEIYSEAAHIQALGKPHLGDDVVENVLSPCPNCHVLFDRGVLQITNDLQVVNSLEPSDPIDLWVHPDHHIDIKYVQRHRSRWPVTS
jgi:predicted restriction endonuclease